MRLVLRLVLFLGLITVIETSELAAQRSRDAFDRESWEAEVAQRGLDPGDVVYPFDASPEMIAWADGVMKNTFGLEPVKRLTSLQQAMFDGDSLDFAYEDSRTLTAEKAFSARSGNCMSFTALFVALSRSIGIPTILMEVRRDPTVGRNDGLVIINRHVVAAYRSGGQVAAFDFFLSSATPFVRGMVIDDVQASAMYHANLGGEALREDDLEAAIHNLEITTILAPDWAVCAFGRGETACLIEAHRCGGKLRVGFENSLLHADGTIARDNAERVTALRLACG